MAATFTVPLSYVISELTLDVLYTPTETEQILISSREVSRPGLELTGFFDYYDNTRILVIGNTENAFLARFTSEERYRVLQDLVSRKPPAIIICRNLQQIIYKCKIYLSQ